MNDEVKNVKLIQKHLNSIDTILRRPSYDYDTALAAIAMHFVACGEQTQKLASSKVLNELFLADELDTIKTIRESALCDYENLDLADFFPFFKDKLPSIRAKIDEFLSKNEGLMTSVEILDRHKNEITPEQYKQNLSIIGNFAIEGMDLDEENIRDLIRVDKGENVENLINEKLIRLGLR